MTRSSSVGTESGDIAAKIALYAPAMAGTDCECCRPRPSLSSRALVATLVLWRKGSLNDIGPTLRTLPPERVIVILAVYATSILVLAVALACAGPHGW